MVMENIEKLVSREKKIFKFLVFYVFFAVFLTVLFITTQVWVFVETAIIVLVIEILITGTIDRGKPLHTKKEVIDELSNIKEIDEYKELRDEYMENKDDTITISLVVYFLGTVALLFFREFNRVHMALSIVGFFFLYFCVYLFFRYKTDKVTIILLERRKIIREMRKERKKSSSNKNSKRKNTKKRKKPKKKKTKKKSKSKKRKKTKKK